MNLGADCWIIERTLFDKEIPLVLHKLLLNYGSEEIMIICL